MRFSNNSNINSLVCDKLKLGWHYRKGKKHHILISPNRRRVAIPSSPSCIRAFDNFFHDIKRLESR
jgi:hypothetical protein